MTTLTMLTVLANLGDDHGLAVAERLYRLVKDAPQDRAPSRLLGLLAGAVASPRRRARPESPRSWRAKAAMAAGGQPCRTAQALSITTASR